MIKREVRGVFRFVELEARGKKMLLTSSEALLKRSDPFA
jgi:hypothetical protein